MYTTKYFIETLKTKHNIELPQNSFFQESLKMVLEEVNNTTYKKVTISDARSEQELFNYVLERYALRLELLFQQLPEPGCKVSLNIHSIPLRNYSHRRGELEPLIYQLKSLY